MSYGKILAPIFGSSGDRATLRTGIALAKQFGAHLEALFVRFDPLQTRQYGPLGGDISGYSAKYFIDAAIRAADEAQAAAAATFADAIEKAGLQLTDAPGADSEATVEMKITQGDCAERIEEESRLADLVVFGADGSDLAVERTREALEDVLLSGTRPVLFVAAGLGGVAPGLRVGIAFDGSAAAAHAVTAALPFIKRAKSVHAFEVTAVPKASTALADLKKYLALHGVEVTTTSVDPTGRNMEDALLDAIGVEHCDLLVLGGYGHSRVREFVFGGMTRHVLRRANLPAVLLAH
jgi:nucleotide-binding universal stress UspA family protein